MTGCPMDERFDSTTEGSYREMLSVLPKVFVVGAITSMLTYGADSSIGTWKLNLAESKEISANPLKSRTEVYELVPHGFVKITRTDLRADGTSLNYSYIFKYDGKEYPVTGARFDCISQRRLDANTTTFEVIKTGEKYHGMGRYFVSEDGKTRTQTEKGIGPDGNPFEVTRIYDRQ
jgi:hypothetical protein